MKNQIQIPKKWFRAKKTVSFDGVLQDFSLPDGFGVSTIDALLQQTPDRPIVVLTGARDEQLAPEAGQRGAQDDLVKIEIPGGVLPRSIIYAIERRQAELKLRRAVDALREANQKILGQQKSVIEEERLKVLLQIAGATSHELNQPLMALLGSIELLRLEAEDPEEVSQHIGRIEGSGRRIAEIVKKMSAIRQVETKPYVGGEAILEFEEMAAGTCSGPASSLPRLSAENENAKPFCFPTVARQKVNPTAHGMASSF